MSYHIKPEDVPLELVKLADEMFEDAFWNKTTREQISMFIDNAIHLGVVRKASVGEAVLLRAMRLMHFALYDERIHVPMAGDLQNYIRQAKAEIAKDLAK